MGRYKQSIADYFFIALGSFAAAVAIVCFLVPLKITTGGVSALSTVLFYYFALPLSFSNFFFNAVLFVFGFKLLGKRMLFRTAFGVITLTVFLEVCRVLPAYHDNLFCASVAGGVLLGCGLGIVIRAEGSTGGSDFFSIMLHRKNEHISVPVLILIVDFLIILLTGWAFSSVTVIIYSLVSLFVATKICDFVLTYGRSAKKIEILSQKSEYIAKIILTEFNRGLTGITCRGMYTGNERVLLMCIVNPRDMPKIISFVRECDPAAFVCVSDIREVLGEGFK